jgi:hypothetical protein
MRIAENNTMRNDENNPTVWLLLHCRGGARWSHVYGNGPSGQGNICNVSGCKCGGVVMQSKATVDRNEASDWYRKPPEHRSRNKWLSFGREVIGYPDKVIEVNGDKLSLWGWYSTEKIGGGE